MPRRYEWPTIAQTGPVTVMPQWVRPDGCPRCNGLPLPTTVDDPERLNFAECRRCFKKWTWARGQFRDIRWQIVS